MISYGIFFYIVIRIFIILIITHFTEIVEAMLLNPGRQQDVIPRFGFDALVLELVMASMLCFQAMLGLRVVQSKKMWESWLLVRVTAVFICSNYHHILPVYFLLPNECKQTKKQPKKHNGLLRTWRRHENQVDAQRPERVNWDASFRLSPHDPLHVSCLWLCSHQCWILQVSQSLQRV
jgi:hypothetical protein